MTNEHQALRIANEDDEALYEEMLNTVIEIEDPAKYRAKIKGFSVAYGAVRDMKERLQGLVNEAEIQPKLLKGGGAGAGGLNA